jgi:hypothetical protein
MAVPITIKTAKAMPKVCDGEPVSSFFDGERQQIYQRYNAKKVIQPQSPGDQKSRIDASRD